MGAAVAIPNCPAPCQSIIVSLFYPPHPTQMKKIIEAISDRTPQFFARLAAFSVALGVISTGLANAPADLRDAYPSEVTQAAQYFSWMAWLLNLLCISQREYLRADDKEDDEQAPDNN